MASAVPPHDPLLEQNAVGGYIFIGYIAVAVLLSTFLITSLFNQWLSLSDSAKAKDTRIGDLAPSLAVVAAISFASLSYHMIGVLTTSFDAWATALDLKDASMYNLETAWAWIKSSTLFFDFAMDLVRFTPAWIWSQLALLSTMGTCIFMAYDGVDSQVPHLWAYFVLVQTLPPSFTQFLFFIATLLSAAGHPSAKQAAAAKDAKDGKDPKKAPIISQVPTAKDIVNIVAAATFVVSLGLIPWFKHHTEYVLPVIAFIRFLLFMPYFSTFLDPKPRPGIPRNDPRAKGAAEEPIEPKFYAFVLLVTAINLLTGIQIAVMARAGLDMTHSMLYMLGNNAPVAVLGFDFVIALGGWVTWLWLSG